MSNNADINDAVIAATEALKIAKISMMMQKDTAFYTSILFSLKQIIVKDEPLISQITTAAVDGKHLYIHPQFFIDLPPNQRISLLAHECLHIALDHMHRRGDRDPKLYNVAGDYVINGMLHKARYELPRNGLLDHKYDGWSTEQVYDDVYQKPPDQQQKMIGLSGGDVQYPEGAGKDGQAKDPVSQDDITEIVLRASTQAKAMGQPGSIPGQVSLQLDRTINPPLPWHIILQNYLTEFSKDDYSFKLPNRRFMPDYYLPTAHSEAVCNLAVCVDTSSSVRDNEFNDFITKISDIQKQMNPNKITVMSFNTKFLAAQVLDKTDDPFKKLKFNGRGGTRIEPVHEWLKEEKPTVAIIFTDGEFQQIEPKNKNIPLVWLIYNNQKWKSSVGGRVIHYDIT